LGDGFAYHIDSSDSFVIKGRVDVSEETNLSVGAGLTLSGDEILLNDTTDNVDDSVSEDEIDDTFGSSGFWFYDHGADTVETRNVNLSDVTPGTADGHIDMNNYNIDDVDTIDVVTIENQRGWLYLNDGVYVNQLNVVGGIEDSNDSWVNLDENAVVDGIIAASGFRSGSTGGGYDGITATWVTGDNQRVYFNNGILYKIEPE
jgi:hypothetical protein